MVTSGSFNVRSSRWSADVKGRQGAMQNNIGCLTGLWVKGMNDPEVPMSKAATNTNLAEGHGRFGRDRLNHWRIAYASAKEVDSHLNLLAQAGAISPTVASEAMSAFDEVRAMTWRLLNPKS